MSRTFNAIERALNAEFKRVERENPSQELKMAIETSTIRKVIRDILSLPPLARCQAQLTNIVFWSRSSVWLAFTTGNG